MKKLFLYLPMILALGSCIQSEPLNAEADILFCEVVNPQTGLKESNIIGHLSRTNTRIVAQANPKINLTDLALKVQLTEGASIMPDPAVGRNYSSPQEFVVTSQNGEWEKVYTVSIDTFRMPTEYRFEYAELNETGRYQVFYSVVKEQGIEFKQYIWASGNAGYSLTGVGRSPEAYPTVSLLEGKAGKGVKLETKSTGDFGAIAKMPIAAGNLFIGNFDVSNAMKDALKATLFGLPFTQKPLFLKGSYKYKRGETFTGVGSDGKPVPVSGEDYCDIYAVLYESAGLEKSSLNGGNVLTSDHIVALARLKDPVVHHFDVDLLKVQYQEFEVAFDYATFHTKRPFDLKKAKNYEYNLAIVFTSSIDGAYFKGATGSTLWIDEVKLVCE